MGTGNLFGTNGIRGVVNKELTPEKAVKVSLAIGTFFKRKNLLVGHDARPSGTEPVYRLYAEAKTKARALKLVEEYSAKLKKNLDTI